MSTSSHLKHLLLKQQSLFLSTLDSKGQPFASYAPYAICFESNTLYVLLSDLSQHSQHLLAQPQAAILVAEDESSTKQIYARERAYYQVTAELINAEPTKQKIIQTLKERHGNVIDLLQQLPDFHLFQLTPLNGRYVKGFGKAYNITAGQLLI